MAGGVCAPKSAEELQGWIKDRLGLSIPSKSVCPHHVAPLEYLKAAFNGEDVVVWAPRGGGKTTLGAVATLIDLISKPGCQVRILGGSLEQSLKMWEHLVPMLEQAAPGLIDGKPQSRRVRLKNGSSAAVLTQSERCVRGNRVQRVRCDEVELFDRDVWQAVQLVPRSISAEEADRRRSADCDGPRSVDIKSSIEAISTLHVPHGLMQEIVDQSAAAGRRVLRWCLLDVLEKCVGRECTACDLHEECKGTAKNAEGFFRVDDAIAMKRRVCKDTWEAEMLCLRPSLGNAVFHYFKPATHVSETDWWKGDHYGLQRTLAIDFGYSDPFVCLWVLHDADGRVYVMDELVSRQRNVAQNIELIRQRGHAGFRMVACDPAGNSTNSQTSRSDVDVLSSAGFEVISRRTHVNDGVDAVSTALCPAAGAPKLRIHPRCQVLIRSMECYHRDEETGKPVKDGINDHCTDALRYYYINRPEPAKAGRY